MYRRLVLAVLTAACSSALAQLPAAENPLENAQLSRQPLHGSLQSTLDTLAQAPAPLWVAYTVPSEASYSSNWSQTRTTYLESSRNWSNGSHTSGNAASHDHFTLLYRLSAGHVDQLRSAGPEETLDAGNLRFVWLEGVSSEASVDTLRSLALAHPPARLADTAVFLISLHRSPAATPALIALAQPGDNPQLREKAAFWLANQRGHDGFLAIQGFAQQDPDAHFREQLAFDLTLSKDPGALPELIRMAQQDVSPRVRRQAQFWMAQQGGKLVAGVLHDEAEHDLDTGVRKQAVFAISRLPQPEATDKLVNLADSSTDPAVRKQAVFWLGQSNDPKALAYLTSLLTTSSH